MLKNFVIFLILFLPLSFSGQTYSDYPKSGKEYWTKKEWRKANTARFSFYMGRQIRQSIRFMNLSRMYGEKFAAIYIDSIPDKSSYELSLIETLRKAKEKKPLRPSPNLWAASHIHAVISGIAGSEGHQGFDARLFIFQPFSYGNMTGENCDYGARKGLDITLDLVIDRGVASLGHRKNILNPEFARVGGARFLHSQYGWNAVFDYSSPKWIDFIFFRTPDVKQYGLNFEISQISDKPMLTIGTAYYANHIKTTNLLADLNYQYGIVKNTSQTLSAYLGYGSSTGSFSNFMIGCKFASCINEPQFNLYIQPTISFFTIISFFRNGYLYEVNDNEKSALYRLSYGYNFNVTGNRNTDMYYHNITLSRFICIKSIAVKGKKNRNK